MKTQAILIHSSNFKKDKSTLEKYSTVKEYKPFNEVRGHSHNGQWYLLIVEKNNWEKICKKHRINYHQTFLTSSIKPFFVKVTKCSPFCYSANKKLIGKTIQVMIDPVNSQYYLIYNPLPIQKLCHSDGNYSRSGFIYGIHIDDCILVKPGKQSIIEAEWKGFKKSLPKNAPEHLTIKLLNKLNQLIKN